MEELSARQKVLEGKREAVAELEAKFKAFHGLPPDLQTARREVQRAQAELDALKRKRDVWFEKM
jgi:outer membrane murein-binding lipoprotein Lpp